MRVWILLLATLCCPLAQADSFDQLLEQVRRGTAQELSRDRERVQRFVERRDQQAALLEAELTRLARLEERSAELQQTLDQNEAELTTREAALTQKLGDLGELFGAIRQASGELAASLDNSMVSLSYPERRALLSELAQSKALPQIEQLEQLWIVMLQEMGELGKTRAFEAPVIARDGSKALRQVVRVGGFAAVESGLFLRFAPDIDALVEPGAQPSARHLATAQAFDTTAGAGGGELALLSLDPTRGQLLDLLTQKPSLQERVQQAGVIGYLILGLGALGLVLALLKYIALSAVQGRMRRQLRALEQPGDDNPLGRILLALQGQTGTDGPAREAAVEAAMLKEVPAIERYTGLLKLLAAVAPLLGLLGTVIGMILTFQSITLFGTSDPKLMAGGISTALVTTVLGLSVAIPLLFAHTVIAAKSRQLLDAIEHQCVGLLVRSGAA